MQTVGQVIIWGSTLLMFFLGASSGGIFGAIMGGIVGLFVGCFLCRVLAAYVILFNEGSSWLK